MRHYNEKTIACFHSFSHIHHRLRLIKGVIKKLIKRLTETDAQKCSKRVTVVNFMMSPNREIGLQGAPETGLGGAFLI